MERLDDYDGRRWCGRASVVEGKERGRELLGGRRSRSRRQADGQETKGEGGRERERAEQSRKQAYWSRLRERGLMKWGTERDGDGWMGGWVGGYGARMG